MTFDMYEGDFTHVGDACTFETLLEQFEIRKPALSAIAEIIHDVGVKDDKFSRAEAPGVAALIAGIALAERDDEARIHSGCGCSTRSSRCTAASASPPLEGANAYPPSGS